VRDADTDAFTAVANKAFPAMAQLRRRVVGFECDDVVLLPSIVLASPKICAGKTLRIILDNGACCVAPAVPVASGWGSFALSSGLVSNGGPRCGMCCCAARVAGVFAPRVLHMLSLLRLRGCRLALRRRCAGGGCDAPLVAVTWCVAETPRVGSGAGSSADRAASSMYRESKSDDDVADDEDDDEDDDDDDDDGGDDDDDDDDDADDDDVEADADAEEYDAAGDVPDNGLRFDLFPGDEVGLSFSEQAVEDARFLVTRTGFANLEFMSLVTVFKQVRVNCSRVFAARAVRCCCC
jgi:hypothetical protein